MRLFEQYPVGIICAICGTDTDKPAVLVPIDGTADGNNEEAMPVHLECLNPRVKKNFNGDKMMIYQLVKEIKQPTPKEDPRKGLTADGHGVY